MDKNRNNILLIVILSVVIAQGLKIFMPMLKGKSPDVSKIFETGGMPSSHSASVSSLCTAMALVYGVASPLFSITFVLATVVMYDATGIRREAGKHAKALNKIISSDKDIFKSEEFKSFKEFLGHTPFEVFMGCLLGIIITVILKGYLVWKRD